MGRLFGVVRPKGPSILHRSMNGPLWSVHTTAQLRCVTALHPPAQKLRRYCIAVSRES